MSETPQSTPETQTPTPLSERSDKGEPVKPKQGSITPDWLVHGVLTKIGDTFDRLTGRGYKPSSSLATSELIERLKKLLDAEVKETDGNKRYVPHNITLKMQWDKFSADSEEALSTLKNEFMIAIVDHINDKHYYTYEPIEIEIKPDYFTTGVKLFAGFEKFADDDNEAAVNVTVPGLSGDELPELPPADAPVKYKLDVGFELNGKQAVRSLNVDSGSRVSVGRTRENDIAIEDISISKFHASLLFDRSGDILVADTGSTNGTFVNGERITYGRSVLIGKGGKVKFGTVNVDLRLTALEPERKAETAAPTEILPAGAVKVGEFQFSKKTEAVKIAEPQIQNSTMQPTVTLPAEQPAPTIEAKLDRDELDKAEAAAAEEWAMTNAGTKIPEDDKRS